MCSLKNRSKALKENHTSIDNSSETIIASPSPKIALKIIPEKGRGIVATETILEGEIFERAPVIFCPANEYTFLGKTILDNYMYTWGKELEDLAVALGYGSLYNHSYHPNALYIKHIDDFIVEFVAQRKIEKGEEITINYGNASPSKKPVWFNAV